MSPDEQNIDRLTERQASKHTTSWRFITAITTIVIAVTEELIADTVPVDALEFTRFTLGLLCQNTMIML